MREFPDAQWSELAHSALVDALVAPAQFLDGAKSTVADGLILLDSGVAHHWFNVAIRTSNELDADAAIRRADAFFGPNANYELIARNWADRDLADAAKQQGFGLLNQAEPYMVLDTDPGEPVIAEWLTIDSTPSDRLATDFVDVAGPVFGDNDNDVAKAREFMRPSAMFNPITTHYVAYVDGKPAATTSLVYSKVFPCIVWVTTHPDYRGRGIASTLVKVATRLAFEQGAAAVTLQASPAGRPVYERLGFREVGTLAKFFRSST